MESFSIPGVGGIIENNIDGIDYSSNIYLQGKG